MSNQNQETKYKNSSIYRILIFLCLAAIGIVGSNLLRIFDYPNTSLLVVFIVCWAVSFVVLTVMFWALFCKTKINPWLSILTMVSPIISILIYVFFGKHPHQAESAAESLTSASSAIRPIE